MGQTYRAVLVGTGSVLVRYDFRADIVAAGVLRGATGLSAAFDSYDDQLGRVFAFLDETGQWDDTLIIFTCDHGEQLGAGGIEDVASTELPGAEAYSLSLAVDGDEGSLVQAEADLDLNLFDLVTANGHFGFKKATGSFVVTNAADVLDALDLHCCP